ncbi:unnamed protein product [Rhodiola kirilowii]
MAADGSFVAVSVPKLDGYYDHWSMMMENFLRSKELDLKSRRKWGSYSNKESSTTGDFCYDGWRKRSTE